MDNKEKIITIDGPAGSGKSTIAKILARDLNMKYIDTGAMYRAVTLIAIENNIGLEDEKKILEKVKKIDIQLESTAVDETRYTAVKLNGRDVTHEIRGKEVGTAVSIVSKLSGVRKYLVELQRKLARKGNAVLEGRDTGSVVCPHAILKIFLTASVEERIKRRKLQLKSKGQKIESHSIRKEIMDRDKIDSGRKDSPLIVPEDGVEVDTTTMEINEVVIKIKDMYKERINGLHKT